MKFFFRVLIFGPAGMILAVFLIFLIFLLPVPSFTEPDDDADASSAANGMGVGLDDSKIPKDARPWVYKAGQVCAEVPPQLIAAQIDQESNWNRFAKNPDSKAEGPSQFIPGTWKTWGRDDDGQNGINPTDWGDALMAQARYDCKLVDQVKDMMQGKWTSRCAKTDSSPSLPPPTAGEIKGRDVVEYALAAYNAGPCRVAAWRGIPNFPETRNYVRQILEKVQLYSTVLPSGGASKQITSVMSYATQQVGKKYTHENPQSPNNGFDCSGLIMYAFNKGTGGSVTPPRQTYDQVKFGDPVELSALAPGDVIVMTITKDDVNGHIGLYLGGGRMVHAEKPATGVLIETILDENGKPTGKYKNTAGSWKVRRYIPHNTKADDKGGSKDIGKVVVPVSGYKLGAYFGQKGKMWSSGYHTGQDFVVPSGTKVKAAAGGVVVTAGWNDAYGNQVVIRHPDGYSTRYAHNTSLKVKVDDKVSAGEVIAISGATGNVTGPHVHFELLTPKGEGRDPVAWLKENGAKP